MEILNNMLRKEEIPGWIRGLKIGRNEEDGMILKSYLFSMPMAPSCFVKLIEIIFYIWEGCCFCFEAITGLRVNLAKISIFSINADENIEELADSLDCKVENFLLPIWGCL